MYAIVNGRNRCCGPPGGECCSAVTIIRFWGWFRSGDPCGGERIDAQGNYVIPGPAGHAHPRLSGRGRVRRAPLTASAFMAEGVAKNGVTSFLPTNHDRLLRRAARGLRAKNSPRRREESGKESWQGAQILGVTPRPFINPGKKGCAGGAKHPPRRCGLPTGVPGHHPRVHHRPGDARQLDCIREMAGKTLILHGPHPPPPTPRPRRHRRGRRPRHPPVQRPDPLMHRDPGRCGRGADR